MVADGIELDKALLEGVREPLAHLVRNAVSHGIESPAERQAAGNARSLLDSPGRVQITPRSLRADSSRDSRPSSSSSRELG